MNKLLTLSPGTLHIYRLPTTDKVYEVFLEAYRVSSLLHSRDQGAMETKNPAGERGGGGGGGGEHWWEGEAFRL